MLLWEVEISYLPFLQLVLKPWSLLILHHPFQIALLLSQLWGSPVLLTWRADQTCIPEGPETCLLTTRFSPHAPITVILIWVITFPTFQVPSDVST